MKINTLKVETSDIAAIGTWLIIFVISMYLLPQMSDSIKANRYLIIGLFIAYLACFITYSQLGQSPENKAVIVSVYIAQLLSAFGLLIVWPMDYFPILTIIWVGMLPHFFSFRNSLLIMLLVVSLWFSIKALLWQGSNILIQALLYGTFHFFAILMTFQTQQAEVSNQKTQSLNKELQATQQLLNEATKQNERTRIARDLHDLLGHHLTALIINLQVATHTSEGEAKEKIVQCHSLAKLLLSDVREAVSSLRENQNLDFTGLINRMVENVPRLKINQQIEAHLALEDLNLAKTLLSCIQESITNCLRHANASEFWLTIKQVEQKLRVELYDNGQISSSYREGNGLAGMRERVAQIDGKLHFNIVQKALQIQIEIPLNANPKKSAYAN